MTFRLVEWDFDESGISTGAKRSRRRVQMQKVREISRGRGVDGVETAACNLMSLFVFCYMHYMHAHARYIMHKNTHTICFLRVFFLHLYLATLISLFLGTVWRRS